MKEAGYGDMTVIVIYVFYNLVYALTSFPIGILADKVGLKKMLLMGLFIFSFVYFGIAFSYGKVWCGVLFMLYGLYYACSDGIAKAWISQLCDKKDTATAQGVFAGLQSIATLLASSLAGFVWYEFGSVYVFIAAGTAAIIACVYLAFIKTAIQHS